MKKYRVELEKETTETSYEEKVLELTSTGKLFPYAEIFKWLSCGHDGKHPACDSSCYGRREFSFTLEHDIYIRFQSFQDAADMENSIREKCPHKIDIGAMYNVDPAKRHAYAQIGDKVFSPIERELVFDIDMTDYDDVRYCYSGAEVCVDCWHLMTIAIKVIDTSLREDFGFEHILWVYSGRRGVHCWVCDGRARRLSNEQRAAIASYFRVYKGSENTNKMVSLSGPVLHPSLTRAYADVLRIYFEEKILPSQKLFSSEDRYQKILDLIPDDSIASQFREKWGENRRSSVSKEDNNIGRWKQLRQLLESGKHRAPGLQHCIDEIVFSYTYPRLDMEVSKHMNHLLKAPFCIHPKTGCVCVPINPDDCENFDPTSVPTLSQLIQELNTGGVLASGGLSWKAHTTQGCMNLE
ncbi:uncharacterized protein LOC131075832 [Cryptomeria japonica]|uniref:uncharacterized protein LOC131075832 n=1 Tax=Cryptomeria japonica TaxID=3369 RepID=UPI0025AD7F80|nr:uncharacterized protein LOC131075832 [Cryptomeria japonica]